MDKQVKILGFDVNFCLFLVNYLINTLKQQRLERYDEGTQYDFFWTSQAEYYLAALRTQLGIMKIGSPLVDCLSPDLKTARAKKREMINNFNELRCFLLDVLNNYQ